MIIFGVIFIIIVIVGGLLVIDFSHSHDGNVFPTLEESNRMPPRPKGWLW